MSTPRECSVAAALDVVGERWSLLVVRELLLGVHRFQAIQRNTGAPRDVLTARLRRLEEQGVIARRQYQERPVRHEYVLTAAGRDLAPVVLTLKGWGDRHRAPERFGGPPLTLAHSCGEEFHAAISCRACGERLGPSSLTPKAETDAHRA